MPDVVVAHDLRNMIDRTYELEARIRDLQETIAGLRQDFEHAVVHHRIELEHLLALHTDPLVGDDLGFGLPMDLDPVPINHPA